MPYSGLLIAQDFLAIYTAGNFLSLNQESVIPPRHLSLADIWLDQSTAQWQLHVRIKHSKTDRFCEGANVVLGATVPALLDYVGKKGGSSGHFSCWRMVVMMQFVSQIQSPLSSAGIHGSSFNGHSFRIGASTTASAAGIPEATIKVLGRWKSMVYQQYVNSSSSMLAGVAPCIRIHCQPRLNRIELALVILISLTCTVVSILNHSYIIILYL